MNQTRKIVAMFPEIIWPEIEDHLHRLQIQGLSLSRIQGFGNYHNFFRNDQMVEGLKLEIYTGQESAQALAAALTECINIHAPDSGLVAIEPVDALYIGAANTDASSS